MSRGARWWIAGIAITAVGSFIRFQNAFRYPPGWGFDARWNWEYIHHVMRTWTLPAPDAGWSTAHPPLFYFLSASLGNALGESSLAGTAHAVRVASSALGLLTVGLAVALVLRAEPGNPRRAFLAGGLLLFLPVQLYMSAMLSEEILASFLISAAVVGVAWTSLGEAPRLAAALGVGVLAGLALLTKLTGLLAIAATAGALLLDGWQRRAPSAGFRHAFALVAVAGAVGGWYYLRNLIGYGYVYPHALDVHSLMFTMPPGFREVGDYFRFPLATFGSADLLGSELLHSVWGSTYVTIWFDGHRHFLPSEDPGVARIGSALLVLGLLPTLAFLAGALRGAGRLLRSQRGPDAVLLLLVALMLTGYVAFTWRNPVFATLKGSFLLGLSVPFAYYASDSLARWTRAHGAATTIVWLWLVLLAGISAATFSFGTTFEKREPPGIQWTPLEKPWVG
jgi:4-amino-4-deoxy-L-arabinose transferase-like glycosyltransferase